jgi:hypothetical protein
MFSPFIACHFPHMTPNELGSFLRCYGARLPARKRRNHHFLVRSRKAGCGMRIYYLARCRPRTPLADHVLIVGQELRIALLMPPMFEAYHQTCRSIA